jgi:hypothetical protein
LRRSPVAGLAGRTGGAADGFDRAVEVGGFVDADLAEPVVDGLELVFSAEDDAVELGDDFGAVAEGAVVAGWRKEEPHDGQVEGHRVEVDLVGVEQPSTAPIQGRRPESGWDQWLSPQDLDRNQGRGLGR